MKNKILACVISCVILSGLIGCGAENGEQQQKAAAEDKITVTVMYYEEMEDFNRLVESTYDDISLEFEQSTLAQFTSDGERRLRKGHGKDLILTTRPDGLVKDYALDLSGYDFAARYQTAVMSNIKQDGVVKYLPMPGNYYGYIINKTYLDRMGLDVPETQQEFMEYLSTAKEKGIGTGDDGYVMGINNVSREGVGRFCIQSMVPDFLGTMDGEEWLTDFIDLKSTVAGSRMEDALDVIGTYVEEGIMDPERLDFSKNTLGVRERMADGGLAACYGTSLFLSEIVGLSEDYEFTMLPFLSAEGNAAWTISSPSAYMAVNKSVESDPRKLDACMRVLDLFSTPEGQAAILKDTRTDNSYLSGYVPEQSYDTGLDDVIKAGNVYNNSRIPSDVVWLLGGCSVMVAEDKMTKEDAVAALDNLHVNGPEAEADDHTLAGSVSQDLLFEDFNCRKEETALGNLVADAVAELSGADIALVNGGGIRSSLFAGDVYISDLHETVPFDNTVVVLEMSGNTLIRALENSIQGIKYKDIPAGKFLQVHGICYEITVDPSLESETSAAGAVLDKVTLGDGTPVDPDARYTVAVNNYMAGNAGYLDGSGDGFTMLNVLSDTVPLAEDVVLIEDTGKTYQDALIAYFAERIEEEISAQIEGRITVKKE